MLAILHLPAMFVADLFKSRRRLEAENLFLRHQLNMALRRAPPRLRLRGCDRALLVWITRIWPNLLDLSQVVKPETILRWHREGFRAFWRWKSRHRAGRPKISRELRDLIRRMSKETRYGAPRASTASSSSLASRSRSRASPSTWSNTEDRHRRRGGHSCATMRTRLRRSTFVWFRP